MSRPPSINRIQKEDFPQEQQAMAEKISGAFNQFMEEVVSLFNKNISYENINSELATIDVSIDSSGNVVNPPSIKHAIRGKVEGVICINATNLDNPTIFPTNQPYVGFGLRTGFIDVKAIKGLQNSSKYRLRLEIKGSSLS